MDFQIFYDAAKLYGYRWTLEILTALRERPLRFTDLVQTITPTPHPKTLRQTLVRLQAHGLIEHPGTGDGALYELTASGHDALPLVMEYMANLQRLSVLHQDKRGQSSGRSSG